MHAITTTQTNIRLTLSVAEAILLKGMMQNAVTHDELPDVRQFREVLFNTLPPFDTLQKLFDQQ